MSTELNIDLPKRGRKKAVQPALPEMEIPQNEEVETKAGEYAVARDGRMAAGRVEKTLKDELLALLHANEITDYERDGISIKLESKGEKLIVKIGGDDDGDDE